METAFPNFNPCEVCCFKGDTIHLSPEQTLQVKTLIHFYKMEQAKKQGRI